MTAFDALVSSGAQGSTAGSRRTGAGGGAGDWRQAVEQAQAKSWLGNRNVDAGRIPTPRGQAPSTAEGVPSLVRQTPSAGTHTSWLPGPRSNASAGGISEGVKVQPPEMYLPPTQRLTASPGVALPRPALAASMNADTTELPPAPPPLAYAMGIRPRKQSLHVETGEQGISVWLRDTALNGRQAHHVAAAVIAHLEEAGQPLAALYLNGRALVDGPAAVSSLLSSPNPSE
ncbi:hypothetical protein J2732_003100 [Achromobacter deleyi]|uniref:hypothetical protein n=1 Tax=Achromobacter deleyi TaxID=1353891 RepID=UPI0028671689|nr:hypothetical protein [Achromobacter deleyi]MDR6602108.1 hypothetical protein [Achromobacter deleyi]